MSDFVIGERMRTAIEALWPQVESLARGEMVSHEIIEQVSGFVRHSDPYTQLVKHLKARLLMERGIDVETIYGSGYRLCTPGEQVSEMPTQRQRRAMRIYRKAERALSCTPTAELSRGEQEERAFRLRELATLRARQQESLRLQRLVGRVPQEV